ITLTRAQRAQVGMWFGGDGTLVKPDPLDDIIVGYSDGCILVAQEALSGGGQGCGPAIFARGPGAAMGSGGPGTFATMAGVAADGVARLRLFLSDGEIESVPMRDNLFAVRYPFSGEPAKLVAYDARGRIVAIQPSVFGLLGRHHPVPSAARRL